MDKILEEYQNIALSDGEVLKLLDGKAKIVLYPEMHLYKTLNEVLEPYDACIILYEAKPRYGHWCCIFKVNEKLVEFFNPYGGFPDDSLDYIPISFRIKSFQYEPYLSRLMYNSKYDLSYNEHKFQELGVNIKTCGRWCAVRILLRDLSLDDFTYLIKTMKKKLQISGDKLVTLLTMYINK